MNPGAGGANGPKAGGPSGGGSGAIGAPGKPHGLACQNGWHLQRGPHPPPASAGWLDAISSSAAGAHRSGLKTLIWLNMIVSQGKKLAPIAERAMGARSEFAESLLSKRGA
jgi:hypothetical protein